MMAAKNAAGSLKQCGIRRTSAGLILPCQRAYTPIAYTAWRCPYDRTYSPEPENWLCTSSRTAPPSGRRQSTSDFPNRPCIRIFPSGCRWRTARCIFLCGRFSTRTGPSATSAAVWLRERNIRGSESCRFPGVFPFFRGNVRLFIQLAKNL